MKCRLILDKQREEEVLIYAHEKTERIEKIMEFAQRDTVPLVGYADDNIVTLDPCEVTAFTVEDGKVYALMDRKKLFIKCRLYMLEGILGEDFLKINQSTLANIRKIERFDASIAGGLIVHFKNGYKDYVSRRQLRTVKERIGF